MTDNMPFATIEVRWFFEGGVKMHPALERWLMHSSSVPRDGDVAPPAWQGRLDGQPDFYLVVPGSEDMGIKWREGALQIKGRVSTFGTQLFCGRHQGRPEGWVKWSYSDLPPAYRQLFNPQENSELRTIPVAKTRALRKVRIHTLSGTPQEVAASTAFERGVGIELTDLNAGGKNWCSLAFEAFPDDRAMYACFNEVVDSFLNALTGVELTAVQSLSYPAWLQRISG